SADLEILDQYVGSRGELAHDAAALLGLEINLDRTFAPIGGVKVGSAEMAAVGGGHEGRPPTAGVVAGALALDLDHVGAEIGENLPGPGAGQDAGKVQNAPTSQKYNHTQTH